MSRDGGDVLLKCPTIGRIASYLDRTREGLTSHTRWDHYRPRLAVRRETILEHTVDTVMLAIIVCDVLIVGENGAKFDPYRVLASSAVHDVGEIVRGDIAFFKKNESDARFERAAFTSIVADLLPGTAHSLQRHFNLQLNVTDDQKVDEVDRVTAEVFEFVERFGYLCFTVAEVHRDASLIPLLVEVSGRQLARLEQLLVQFPELDVLFPHNEREAVRSLTHL